LLLYTKRAAKEEEIQCFPFASRQRRWYLLIVDATYWDTR